jgi:hypothetical protein
MKKTVLKRSALLILMAAILATNMIGINAFATGDGDPVQTTTSDDPPPGVLAGYMPSTQKIRTGEHIEHFGWVGGSFTRLVAEYTTAGCCLQTFRAMDGCSGLPKCEK